MAARMRPMQTHSGVIARASGQSSNDRCADRRRTEYWMPAFAGHDGQTIGELQ